VAAILNGSPSFLFWLFVPLQPYLVDQPNKLIDTYYLGRHVVSQMHDQPLNLVQQKIDLVFHVGLMR
jgi:hypothetical protein